MGEIVLTRIDDRLIHGQVMTAWTKKTGANQIVIVDDDVAQDDFMSEVMKAAAPSGVEIKVESNKSAVEVINNIPNTNKKTIILAKGPKVIKNLLDSGVIIKKLIVGGMGLNQERKSLYKNIAASQEERKLFQEIINQGCEITIHIIPDQNEVEINKYL